MLKVELSSFAKDLDSLKRALESGADSVYIGGETFGMNTMSQKFSIKDLQVIVLVPSYKSNINRNFPFFNSLESVFITSPSRAIFPLSMDTSITFTNGSLIF